MKRVTEGSIETRPGPVALFGSGEAAPAGRQVHEMLFAGLAGPVRVAVLETPAGFQPNSAWVAGRLAQFVRHNLRNFHPQVTVVPARRRDGPHSTDDPQLAASVMAANYIFAGPGSPTYAVQHLQGTWVWHALVARQRRGAAVALASAVAIAAGSYALPVYEIYKAGTDPHWTPGLDLLRPYGLELAIVTHWNNQEGGAHLDTRRAFMGIERMTCLEALLPSSATILGIDEHTAAVLDLAAGTVQVRGQGGVTVRRGGSEQVFTSGSAFPLTLLGDVRLPELNEGLPSAVVEAALATEQDRDAAPQVTALIEEREVARRARDWPRADQLRERLAGLGYAVEDTPDGPRWRLIVSPRPESDV